MAALDPTAAPIVSITAPDAPPRSTLKIVRVPLDVDDESDEDFSEDDEDMLNGMDDDDSEDSEDDEEANGGPSDLTKSKKARREAAVKQIQAALANGADETEVDDNEGSKTLSKGKGKLPADADSEEDEDGFSDLGLDEYVVCTLDPIKVGTNLPHSSSTIPVETDMYISQTYQQPLDITVNEGETVYFKVSGTHAIWLTGNYVMPVDDTPSRSGRSLADRISGDDDYDMSPDEDEMDYSEDDSEEDELDDMADPRITEVGSDEEAPKLLKTANKKRPAKDDDDEESGMALDDILAKAMKPAEKVNGEKLSKKQLKKLKNNAGKAVPVTIKAEGKAEAKADAKANVESPNGKKVQFAKNLEQGPTGSKSGDKKAEKAGPTVPEAKKNEAKKDDKPKAAAGIKTVQGIKIEDKKIGTGPAAKKGSTVGMRYIGKLQDGKVFDCKLLLNEPKKAPLHYSRHVC